MSRDGMADDTLPDGWWNHITLDELARASGVIAQFQASISVGIPATAPSAHSPVASADQVARAIILRRLTVDDQSLEGLVQLAETARAEVRKAVVADKDLRGDDGVSASRRLAQALRPVLLLCGQMLRSRPSDTAGKDALDLDEKLRAVLFDYNLLNARYGART